MYHISPNTFTAASYAAAMYCGLSVGEALDDYGFVYIEEYANKRWDRSLSNADFPTDNTICLECREAVTDVVYLAYVDL